MARPPVSDRRQERFDRYERRSNALAEIFGLMNHYENELPDDFKEHVGETCVEWDVDQGKHWQE